MNYINKGKRDILIFPKFHNISKIQNIRNKYDELAQILPPHITLVFPFKKDITNEYIHERLEIICNKYKSFKIKCEGITIKKDEKINKYFIYLNIVEGNDIITRISMDIYHNILDKEFPNNYIPHITLGTIDEITNIKLDDIFETTIDTIFVESIGENEESNIEFEVKLQNF